MVLFFNDSDILVEAEDAAGEEERLGDVVEQTGGDPLAPSVHLSEIGKMVERELLTSIQAHYPMVEVQDYVVMPDHLHFIVVVHRNIVSSNGRETHLGQVIAGFKKGCNCSIVCDSYGNIQLLNGHLYPMPFPLPNVKP